jgi:5'-nucleotidase
VTTAIMCGCNAQLQPHSYLAGVCPEQPKLAIDDRGPWMALHSGGRYHPLDPRAEDIDPVDIAHALGMLCRYGGHINHFYSVAEHCVLMSYAVPPEDALSALLHDATEAYVVDVPRPVKRLMPEYEAIEKRVWLVIAERFGISPDLPRSVKAADNNILADEVAVLLPSATWAAEMGLTPLGTKVTGWLPDKAARMYTARLEELLK